MAVAMMLLMMPAAVVAEPKVLSDIELDATTAAGILVDVSSVAVALGDLTRVGTDAKTFAFAEKHLDLAIGFTKGQALACCGDDAEVDVGSAAVGIGDIVHGIAHAVQHDGRPLAYGLSVGFIIAVSFGEYFAAVRDKYITFSK